MAYQPNDRHSGPFSRYLSSLGPRNPLEDALLFESDRVGIVSLIDLLKQEAGGNPAMPELLDLAQVRGWVSVGSTYPKSDPMRERALVKLTDAGREYLSSHGNGV